MKMTKTQLKKYLAGELKLVTRSSIGASRLVPAKPTGKITPARRAYYRLWYAANRAKRLAYNKKQRRRKLRLTQPVKPLAWATADPAPRVVRTKAKPVRQPRSWLRRLAEWLTNG